MDTIVTSVWQKSKLLVKCLMIGALILLLLIPEYFVTGLIHEREQRQKEAIAEVSSKWAGRQIITGPVIVLPFWQTQGDTSLQRIRTKHYAYFLPDELKIQSSVTPHEKYRGIYKIMLYNSKIRLSGTFNEILPQQLNIAPQDIIWEESFVKLHISDSKGLNDEIKVQWGDRVLPLVPKSMGDRSSNDALSSPLNVTSVADLKNISFSVELNLNGSEQLLFTPVGRVTTVNVTSTWPHPSFTGNILPQTSTINSNGFEASWKSLSHNRHYPQQWKDDEYSFTDIFPYPRSDSDYSTELRNTTVTSGAFGTDIFVPVNSYQKIMRSIKYAILCILLTFAAFFIIETVNKKSVHPFQYALIGAALILFYTLLLSFSEYTGFNIAYILASVATVGLIAWFVKGILQSSKLTLILSIVLVLMYSYVFTILQLQDYSLILGSIGLFLTLAVIMHFSKKIQW